MRFNVVSIPSFDKQAKRLAKKHPSFTNDLVTLILSLETNPLQGTNLGNDCYKIRLAIKSKGKGKSAGARVITHIHISQNNAYLISVYDKSEQISISDARINELLSEIE